MYLSASCRPVPPPDSPSDGPDYDDPFGDVGEELEAGFHRLVWDPSHPPGTLCLRFLGGCGTRELRWVGGTMRLPTTYGRVRSAGAVGLVFSIPEDRRTTRGCPSARAGRPVGGSALHGSGTSRSGVDVGVGVLSRTTRGVGPTPRRELPTSGAPPLLQFTSVSFVRGLDGLRVGVPYPM